MDIVDRIIIEALEIDTIIGAYRHEQEYHQRLLLDLELSYDFRSAAATDDLAQTLDYAQVCARLREYARVNRVVLVETLVERFAELLHREYSVSRMRLHLRKPSALAETGAVGIAIERNFS